MFQKRINATLDGLNKYKYNRDTIEAIDVTEDGTERLRFKDGSSVPMVNVESMDYLDRHTGFDIPGTNIVTPNGAELKDGDFMPKWKNK